MEERSGAEDDSQENCSEEREGKGEFHELLELVFREKAGAFIYKIVVVAENIYDTGMTAVVLSFGVTAWWQLDLTPKESWRMFNNWLTLTNILLILSNQHYFINLKRYNVLQSVTLQ